MILPYLTQIPLSQVSSFLKKSEHSLFVSQSAFPCRKSKCILKLQKKIIVIVIKIKKIKIDL